MVGQEFCVLGRRRLAGADRAPGPRGAPTRFNDCKVDPRGRLLAGTMVLRPLRAGAALRLDPDGTLTPLLGGRAGSPTASTGAPTARPSTSPTRWRGDRRVRLRPRRGHDPQPPAARDDPTRRGRSGRDVRRRARAASGRRRSTAADPPLRPGRRAARGVATPAAAGLELRVRRATAASCSSPRSARRSRASCPGEPGHRRGRVIDAATANPDNGLLLSCRPGVTGPPATPFG